MKLLTENWEAKIGSLIVAILIYAYLQNTKILSRTVNIPVEYPRLHDNYEYSRNNPKTVIVRVSGKRELVSYYTQFMKAILVKKDFQPGENEAQIKKIDGVPNGIKVSIKTERIIVVVEEKADKQVLLEAVFTDKTPDNYLVSSFFIKPNKVRISGKKSVIARINKLKLEPISLAGKKESFTRKTRIDTLPKGVTVQGGQEFAVRVNIMASSTNAGEQTVSGIPISCTGLDDGLESELSSEEATVKFYSAKPVNSVDVIKGLTATLNCNYLYDRVAGKILPNDKPVLLRVKINKSPTLKDLEILKVNPVRIRAIFKIKTEHSDDTSTSGENNLPEEDGTTGDEPL